MRNCQFLIFMIKGCFPFPVDGLPADFSLRDMHDIPV